MEILFREPLDDGEYLKHYGVKRRSGRYPYGSGEDPYQHADDFLARVQELKKAGMSEVEIARAFKLTTSQLRAQKTIANEEIKADQIDRIHSLEKDGLNRVEIAKKMGLAGESTVRSILHSEKNKGTNRVLKLADNIQDIVDEKGIVDIGKGTEKFLGTTETNLKAALEILKFEGYEIKNVNVPQVTNSNQVTTMKLLCRPGTEYKEAYANNFGNIASIADFKSEDGGMTLRPSFVYPKSLNANRIKVRYAEEGGIDKDGLIEIRRGCKDLSLGPSSNYAQVRIMAGEVEGEGTHYLKGMAVYGNDKDFPPGVDVIFNTNKKVGTPMCGKEKTNTVLKHIKKDDPDNPFGSLIKERGGQYYYDDPNGDYTDPITGRKQSLGLINKRSDEGDWGDWNDTLASQFLSKQPMKLINRQLNLSIQNKQDEYDEIMSLTNPVLKRTLLEKFAEDCDTSAVNLKAATFANQKFKAIIPMPSLNNNECYCPSYENGTQIALVRYPHGGIFEIPVLTVNNNNSEGKKMIGNSPIDAIGINAHNANVLSGADFDGDTVMCVPMTDEVKIAHSKPLFEDFDTKTSYGPSEIIKDDNGVEHFYRNGMEYKTMKNTPTQMGIVSNLITDMTLKGASSDELARAVKHSMVVIDAEKHHLDYKSSERENHIDELKKKYQLHDNIFTDKESKGASTLISQAKGKILIKERKEGAYFLKDSNKRVDLIGNNTFVDAEGNEYSGAGIARKMSFDPNTGEKVYTDTNRQYKKVTYVDEDGKKVTTSVVTKNGKDMFKRKSTGKYEEVTDDMKVKIYDAMIEESRMNLVSDARLLSSGFPQEDAYANYANKLKAMANNSRKQLLTIETYKHVPAATKEYSNEVDSLNAKLNKAEMNAPRERQAQIIANTIIKAKINSGDERLSPDNIKKIKQQAIVKAREEVGAHREQIDITPKEWEAIAAGAMSTNLLVRLFKYADDAQIKSYAMPRDTVKVSQASIDRARRQIQNGKTSIDVANSLGISVNQLSRLLYGKEEK